MAYPFVENAMRTPATRTVIAFLVSLILCNDSPAQTFTWIGPNSNWNQVTNWTPTGIPNSASAQAIFNGGGVALVNIGASVQTQSISFSIPTGGYTLTSSAGQILSGLTAINVNAGVTGVQTINLANVANGSLLFTGSGPAALTITNNSTVQFVSTLVIGPNTVIGTPGGGGITVTGSGNTTISASFTTNPSNQVVGGLTQDSTAQLTLSGNGAALSGGINLSSGFMTWDYSTNTAAKFGVIGNLTLGHGQLTLNSHATTAVTQNMPSGGGTIFNDGDMWVQLNTNNGTRAAITLNAGAVSRVGTATANFILDVGATMTTTTGLTNGIIGPWAAMNHQTWATKSGSSIVLFTAFGTDVYSPGTHTDVTTGAGIPDSFTTSTLRFATPLAATMSGVNTLSSGAILTSFTGYGSSISGGTLVNGSSEWIVHSFGNLTIDSSMTVNGRMILAGGGQLTLGGAINWAGGAPLMINYGGVNFTNASAFSGLTDVRYNNRVDSSQFLRFQLPDGQDATFGAGIQTTGRAVISTANSNVMVNSGINSRITLSGVISSAGNQSVLYMYADASTNSGFHLTGANTFSGDVYVGGGVLGFMTDSNLGAATNRVVLNDVFGPGGLQFLSGGVGLAHPLKLNSAGRLIVTGANINSIDSPISGTGSLNKFGTGTLVVANPTNSYTGGTYVNEGRLRLGHGDAIPANSYLEVRNGAEFNTGGFSNVAANRLDLYLDRGIFRAPANGEFHLRNLWMNGGTIDPSGATDFALRFGDVSFVSANNTAAGPARWLGSGNSRIVNDTGNPLPIYSFGSYFGTPNPIGLDVDAIMSGSGPSQGFVVGGFGPMRITNPANTADFTVQQSTLRVDDVTTGGFGALGSGAINLTNGGTLAYGGSSATLTKPIGIDIAFGGFRILNNGVNLTITGGVTQTGASDTGVYFLGPMQYFGSPDRATIKLPTNNSYAGGTHIHLGAIVEIDSLPDTGDPSPIGTGFAGPGSLVLGYLVDGRGELKITGTNASYTTNRDITVGGLATVGAGGAINIANAGTNLTLTGQIFDDSYSGASSLSKAGPGTLTLANAVNTYTGGTYVEAGRLALGVGTAIPTGGNVTVLAGAEFNTGGLSNDRTTAIGAVTLTGGTLRVPSGSPYYYVNKLVMNGAGAAIDLTGTTGITGLSLVGAGAGISVSVNSTWTGPISSFVANGSNAELPIFIAPNVTLTSDLSLAVDGFLPPNSARLSGGGTLYLRNPPQYVADLTVNQARLRLDNLTNVGPLLALKLDNGTLAYGGSTQSYPAAFTVGLNGGAIEVLNGASTLTLTGAITDGGGTLTKTGPGTLILNQPANTYFGGIVVNAGRLDVGNDNQIGQASITVNPAGTIRFTNSTTTARNYTLFNGSMDVVGGVTLSMNGANVFGGFLRGNGLYNLTGNASLTGVTTFNTTTMNVTGPASLANFANNGSVTVAAGQTLSMNYATNGSGGLVTVNGAANVSNFVSTGRLAINPGGTFNNSQSNMTVGGGSVTTIGLYNPANGQVTLGGTLNFGSGDLRVQGGFVRNNGTITGTGDLVIDFGGLVKGVGEIDTPRAPIRINGGQLLAGNSPGLARVVNFSLVSTSSTGGDFSNATGIAGPPPTSAGAQLSGWSVFEYGNLANTGGSAVVEGTPAARAIWQFRTVLDSGDYSTPGVPANFNAAQGYVWQIVRPRSNADVGNPTNITPINTVALVSILDTATMQTVPLSNANLNTYLRFDDSLWNWGAVPVNDRGTFGFVLLPDALGNADRVIGLAYTPVPEPFFVLTASFAAIALIVRRSRKRSGFGTITAWPK